MPIGNIDGYSNPYQTATPPADTSTLGSQNREAAETDLNQENTRVAQQAFQVELTQEAQDRQAAAAEETGAPAEETPPLEAPQQTSQTPPETSRIVNIVA